MLLLHQVQLKLKKKKLQVMWKAKNKILRAKTTIKTTNGRVIGYQTKILKQS